MDLALKFIELQVIDLTLWLIKDLFSGWFIRIFHLQRVSRAEKL
jgi:hypothetical protein